MWSNTAIQLDLEIDNLLGDIILSAGSISFLGAFMQQYRSHLIEKQWIPKILEEEIVCS